MTSCNRTHAIEGHRLRLRQLTDAQARNLMENAANNVPLLPVTKMSTCFWDEKGRCTLSVLAAVRHVSIPRLFRLIEDDEDDLKPQPWDWVEHRLMSYPGYYSEIFRLDHDTLRRLWVEEGERRGYVLEADHD